MSVDKAKSIAEIVKIVMDIYGAFVDRAEKRDSKERRIKELEAELQRLKDDK